MLTSDFDNYSHFSFDLDGTLIDSLSIMEFAWETVNNKTGINIPFIRYKQSIGLPFDQILANIGVVEGKSEIRKIYFEATQSLAKTAKIYEGAAEVLHALAERKNTVVSIITSKPLANAMYLLNHFDLRYSGIIAGDSTELGKPSMAPFLKIEENLGLEKDLRVSTVYFGDMLSDFAFATNCNISYCHCNFGFYGHLSRRVRSPYLAIESWRDVLV
jgi:HAD superfamily hydrolase (TIGR01549 family)